mmetsp:Transcript_58947/g.156156  ORF Transcript_58947/g.156156 Transcript_58947/m.156156 type:complete len:250 (-) Transcript_58947:862-1611(-)
MPNRSRHLSSGPHAPRSARVKTAAPAGTKMRSFRVSLHHSPLQQERRMETLGPYKAAYHGKSADGSATPAPYSASAATRSSPRSTSHSGSAPPRPSLSPRVTRPPTISESCSHRARRRKTGRRRSRRTSALRPGVQPVLQVALCPAFQRTLQHSAIWYQSTEVSAAPTTGRSVALSHPRDSRFLKIPAGSLRSSAWTKQQICANAALDSFCAEPIPRKGTPGLWIPWPGNMFRLFFTEIQGSRIQPIRD